MTLYTAFEMTPAGRPAAGLDDRTFRVLTALFDADGATAAQIGARAHTSGEAVEETLGTLSRLGLVERDGDAAWMTGEAFGLRRSVGSVPVDVKLS